MAVRRRIGRWLLAALGAAIILALVIYLFSVGLDKADKLSSAISGVLAVIAVVASLFWRRRPAAAPPEPAPIQETAPPQAGRGVAYLEDVRQLAPRELLDRGPELAQLATFCADDTSTYWRWVADAWSGKTALLAWFVLHPPENVDVISFFITSRFNPHYNRDAFIEAVTEQVDALIGRTGFEGNRTRHLQARLTEAAGLSHQNGRRLVLVVDGLDEDRGVMIDSETYTIAALLPADPVPGLKLIVAGRPHPPLPAEISQNHPLRLSANVHPLSASSHARANQATAGLELRRLLGDAVGRRVLGLLVAAGGGLTVADLAVLTQQPRHEIRQLLESSASRTFVSRPGRWRRGSENYTFGLAHEELRRETLRSLDPPELDGYRQSLTDWADTVAADAWPPDTPEYLLRGHLGQLTEAGELDRAVVLVSDEARHERMLTLTGGDHAAQVDIAEVARAIQSTERPALGLLAQLALSRERLEVRNSRLPTELPALWVKLGEYEKADALARGISRERDRRAAVEQVTSELIRRGDDRQLERIVRTSADPDQVLQLLTGLLLPAVWARDADRVDALVTRILTVLPSATDERRVYDVMTALARAGGERAEQAQRLIDDPFLGVFALLGRAFAVVREDALAEQLEGQARAMAAEVSEGRRRVAAHRELELAAEFRREVRESAERLKLSPEPQPPPKLQPPSEPQPPSESAPPLPAPAGQHQAVDKPREQLPPSRRRRLKVLAQRADELEHAGDNEAAQALVDEACRITAHLEAHPDDFPEDREYEVYRAVVRLASVSIGTGGPDRAAELATWVQRSVARRAEHPRTVALEELGTALARSGEATRAEAILAAVPDGFRRNWIQRLVFDGALERGDDELAEAVGRRLPESQQPISHLAEVVRFRILHGADGLPLAEDLVGPLTSDRSPPPFAEAEARTAAIVALAADGRYEAAERLNARVADATRRQYTLFRLCLNAVRAGHVDAAERLFEQLEEPAERASILTARLTTMERPEQAGELLTRAIAEAEGITRDRSQIFAWGEVVKAATGANLGEQVAGLVDRMAAKVDTLSDPDRDRALRVLTNAARRLSRHDQAAAALDRITSRIDREMARNDWLAGLAATGDIAQLEDLIAGIENDAERDDAWISAAEVVAAHGGYRQAERFADQSTRGHTHRIRTAIVKAAAEAGDFTFAEAMIGRTHPDDAASYWCVLVEVFGDPADARVLRWLDRAETAAAEIGLVPDRFEALVRVAEVADPERARRVVARALADGPWHVPLPQLVRLDPDGLAKLADVVIDLVARRRSLAGG